MKRIVAYESLALVCVSVGCSSASSTDTAGSGGRPAAGASALGGAAAQSSGGETSAGGATSGLGGVQSAAGGTNASGGNTAAAGGAGTGGQASSMGGAGGSGGVGGALGSAGGGAAGAGTNGASALEAAQRAFVELRFGMFLHFGILTYTGEWSQANLPIEQFNPSAFDPNQWAEAAAAAHMRYAVLTARHHDGFALWPSAAGTFNVGHIPWKNGQGDVVRAYVDAFRSRGIAPGLYYSVWDNTQGMGNGAVTPAQMAYVKAQLSELLTNYGPIPILVLDGWSWRMGHRAAAYQELRELVKSLQPDCLVTDHTHLAEPWDVDIVNFEEPRGVFAPAGNTFAAQQEQKINASGGNDWFWAPNIGGLMTLSAIVDAHLKRLEPLWTNFLLNCPPNREGLLDPAMVSLLKRVGESWSPNLSRAPLPSQGEQNAYPYTPVSATATSGTAANAIDGINDATRNTVWQTSGALPASITLDLGVARPDVGYFGYVPRRVNGASSNQGNVTQYDVALSLDGNAFTSVSQGAWPADGKMKTLTFGPAQARYLRFQALAASGGVAAATELTVGARR